MPAAECPSFQSRSTTESWPLLDVPATSSVSLLDVSGSRRRIESLQDRCRTWWLVTTGLPYLTSPLSRRTHRLVSVPLLACWTVLPDVAFGAPTPYASLAALLLLGPVALLPSSRLSSDCLAGVAAYVHSLTWLLVYGSGEEHYLQNALLMKISYWTFTLSICTGVHSVVLLAYVSLLSASLSYLVGALASIAALLFGLSAVLAVALLENRIGGLMTEWSKQQTCIKNLLEGLSDGACTVDAATGIVETATRKLAQTFEVPDMEGRNLVDFLQRANDRGQIEEMLRSLDKGGFETFAPRLMSCQTGAGPVVFEAMMVPFSTVEHKLSLGVRLVGEKRRGDSQDIWPSDLTLREDLTNSTCSVAATCGSAFKKPGPPDVSFALSWGDEAVQKALLAPRRGGGALGTKSTSIGIQTDVAEPPAPVPTALPTGAPAASAEKAQEAKERGGAGLGPGASKPPPAPSNFLDGPANLPLPPGFHRRPDSGSRRSSGSQGSRRSRPRSVGSMSSNTSRSSGESSAIGSSAGALRFPSIASCFLDTALLTRRKSIIIAMHHWNLPRNPDACCPWHTAVCAVEEVAKLEARTPCKPLWSPFLGWQCATCTCVNHPTVSPCNVCGSERPAAAGGTAQDQASAPPPLPGAQAQIKEP